MAPDEEVQAGAPGDAETPVTTAPDAEANSETAGAAGDEPVSGQSLGQDAGQELGRVERPPADQFLGKRRLLLVPILMAPPENAGTEAGDGQAIYARYWEQVRTQVDALAAGLGGLHRIYHENLVSGGEEGLEQVQAFNAHAHPMLQVRCHAGATLEAVESIQLITESLDLNRCLMLPLTNEGVAARLEEWLVESTRNRYGYIAQHIDQTLQSAETGLLLINERHQVQFPNDVEVFYVAPPALDEYRRWTQNWIARQQQAQEAMLREMAMEAEEEDAQEVPNDGG